QLQRRLLGPCRPVPRRLFDPSRPGSHILPVDATADQGKKEQGNEGSPSHDLISPVYEGADRLAAEVAVAAGAGQQGGEESSAVVEEQRLGHEHTSRGEGDSFRG